MHQFRISVFATFWDSREHIKTLCKVHAVWRKIHQLKQDVFIILCSVDWQSGGAWNSFYPIFCSKILSYNEIYKKIEKKVYLRHIFAFTRKNEIVYFEKPHEETGITRMNSDITWNCYVFKGISRKLNLMNVNLLLAKWLIHCKYCQYLTLGHC